MNDLQELAQTYYQISCGRCRSSIASATHYLPLYFPEVERFTQTRAQWFTQLLHRFPCPTAITRYSQEAFEQEAGPWWAARINAALSPISRNRQSEHRACRHRRLRGHPDVPRDVGGTPAPCATRAAIEHQADQALQSHPDYHRLHAFTGRGADSRPHDFGRPGTGVGFRITRQFLKFCGFTIQHAVRPVSWDKPAVEAAGNARLICLLDGCQWGSPDASGIRFAESMRTVYQGRSSESDRSARPSGCRRRQSGTRSPWPDGRRGPTIGRTLWPSPSGGALRSTWAVERQALTS